MKFIKQELLNDPDKASNIKIDIMSIRNRLVNASIIAILLFMLPGSVISIYRLSMIESKLLINLHIYIFTLLVFLFFFRKRTSFYIRVSSIIILWLLLGGLGILTWGLIGMGITWLMALCIWTSITLGIRYGAAITLFCTGIIILTGMGVSFNIIQFDFDMNEYSRAASAWRNAEFSFGFITAIIITCIWHLNASLVNINRQSQNQVAELLQIKSQLENETFEHRATEEKLINSENEKKAILNGMSNTQITFIDPEMNIIWANDAVKTRLGERCAGHKCHKIKRDLDTPCHDCIAINVIQSSEFSSGEVNRSDGVTLYVQCNPVKNQNEDLVGIVVAATDISELKQVEENLKKAHEQLESSVEERTKELAAANESLENAVINANKMATESVVRNKQLNKEIEKRKQVEIALKNNEVRYRSIIENIDEGYFEMDIKGNISFFNTAFCQLSGFSAKEIESKPGKSFLTPEWYDDVLSKYSEVFRTGTHKSEYCYDAIRKDGTRLTVESSISLIADINDKITGFRGIIRDVDKRKKYEENLVYLAYHDALTGLFNRKSFYERIEEILHQAKRNNYEIALAFIDIDKFKVVNDTLGHEAGDELLKAISGRLVSELRKTDYVFRPGGDEFTIIFPQSENIQLDIILTKIINCLSRTYSLGEKDVDYVSASVGVSLYPRDAKEYEALIRNADTAMYKAKEKGNRYVYFGNM